MKPRAYAKYMIDWLDKAMERVPENYRGIVIGHLEAWVMSKK